MNESKLFIVYRSLLLAESLNFRYSIIYISTTIPFAQALDVSKEIRVLPENYLYRVLFYAHRLRNPRRNF